MAKKELRDVGLTKGDNGFVHERIELCENLVSLENHSFSAYSKTVDAGKEDPEEMRRADTFRKLRRDYMKPLVAEGPETWCRTKHLLEAMMRLKENAFRYVMAGDMDNAKQCAKDYATLYAELLEMNKLI